MIDFILICAFALAALIGMWLAVRGARAEFRSLDDLPRLAQPVDLEAFLNLVDPAEEMYLRAHLAAADFVEIRRERLENFGVAGDIASDFFGGASGDVEVAGHDGPLRPGSDHQPSRAILLALAQHAAETADQVGERGTQTAVAHE